MAETHVIVGAGQAGGWAALAMREAGFQGHIILVGEEPWRPYERPPLSKTMLTAPEEPPVLYFHDAGRYAEQGVELRLGEVVEAIDGDERTVTLRDGTRLQYDRLLLTTGGTPRRLRVPGGDSAVLLRTLEDARRLRELFARAPRVVCIGAGVIGLEIASSARERGCDVTVLEAAPRPLGRCMSVEAASFVERLHRKAGTTIRCDIAITGIEPDGTGGYLVGSAEGDAIAADIVIAGIGMDRNAALAARAGVVVDNGILVDEFGRTSVPGIFAAGDVAAFEHPFYQRRLRLESWRHAQNHGIAVGKAMAGQGMPHDDIPWFWTDQYGVNIQVTGLPEDAARTIVRQDEGERFLAVHLAADDSVVAVTAAGHPREIRAGTALIRSRRPVDARAASDPAVPLQQLLRR